MIDIHSHILPGLDDGSRSMEQTLSMLRIASAEGIHTIIATPHSYGHRKSASVAAIQECVAKVRLELEKEKIPITLYVGNEIYYRQGAEEELENGEVNTLVGSRYVLVEFHPQEDYQYIMRALNRLSSYGYIPILAHAERYENLFPQKERIEEIKKCGVKIQVNAASVCEHKWGNIYRKRVWQLLKEQLVDYIASDAHSDVHRAPRVKECQKLIEKKLGKEYADACMEKNAGYILK